MYVTNKNEFDHKDRYNGVDFFFPQGQSVQIDLDAARHIFGVGESDKSNTLIRSGWATTQREWDSGMKILGNFVFSDEPLQESTATVDTPAAAPSAPPEVSAAPIPETAPAVPNASMVDTPAAQDATPSPSQVEVNPPPTTNGSGNLLERVVNFLGA